MTREEAKALFKKHGSFTKAAAASGMSRKTFTRFVNGETEYCGQSAKPVASGFTPHVAARSLKEFQLTYDKNTIVPKKIAEGFKQLGAGWLYESEFAKAAGLTMKDLGMFRDQYAEHIVVVGDSRRIWAGRKQTAEEMRQMI